MLCAIGDPHNLGSILRSSYFCGVEKVFTTDCKFENVKSEPFLKSTAPLTPVVSKSSSGVLELFQPVHINDPIKFIKSMKCKGYTIVGSGIKNDCSSTDCVHDNSETLKTGSGMKRSLLIVGNEGFGIPINISTICDKWIYLEPGRVLDSDIDSLNVSVATALLVNSIKNLSVMTN